MFKTIKKHWRKSKNFDSAFSASIIPSFFFGKYISVLLNITDLPIWHYGIKETLFSTIVFIIVLFFPYIFYMYCYNDLSDKKNFYDNFFMSLIVVTVSTFMILYNVYLPKPVFSLESLLITILFFLMITMSYLLVKYIFIKLRPK